LHWRFYFLICPISLFGWCEPTIHEQNLIIFENVYKFFKEVCIFKDLSIRIPLGKILLLGSNGSGKTTFFKLCCGLQKVQSGQIKVIGFDNSNDLEAVKKNISYAQSEPSFQNSLTSADLYDYLATYASTNRIEELETCFNAEKLRNMNFGKMSSGEKQTINLIFSLSRDCPLYLLDEPLHFLDVTKRLRLIAFLMKLQKNIIIASHEVNELMCVTDYVATLNYQGPKNGSKLALSKIDANKRFLIGLQDVSAALNKLKKAKFSANFVEPLIEIDAAYLLDLIDTIGSEHLLFLRRNIDV